MDLLTRYVRVEDFENISRNLALHEREAPGEEKKERKNNSRIKKKNNKDKEGHGKCKDEKSRWPLPSMYDSYTPLNKSVAEIFILIKDITTWKLPHKMYAAGPERLTMTFMNVPGIAPWIVSH